MKKISMIEKIHLKKITINISKDKEIIYSKNLEIREKDLQRLIPLIDDIKYDLINSSVTICHDSKKNLYRAYYHGRAIFRSKNIEKLKEKIKNWDIEFQQWYKEGNIF